MIEFVLQSTGGLPYTAQVILAVVIGLIAVGFVAGMVWFVMGAENS